MTTCEAVRERLDDFVDGLLDLSLEEDVRRHLGACAACAAEERALRRLVESARALPRELAPPRDLWPEIAGRLGGWRQVWGRGVWLWGGLAAAAALVVVATLAGHWQGGPAAPAAPDNRVGEAVQVSYERDTQALEDEYAQAERAFLAVLEARKEGLSPASRARVDASLRAIDRALADIRAELRERPADPRLNLLLASVHQKKVDVLRTVVRLTT